MTFIASLKLPRLRLARYDSDRPRLEQRESHGIEVAIIRADSERFLGSQRERFSKRERKSFPQFFEGCLRSANVEDAEHKPGLLPILVHVIVQGWFADFREELLKSFPNFPGASLDLLEATSHEAQSALPTLDALKNFNFSAEHIGVHERGTSVDEGKQLSIGDRECLRIPIVAQSLSIKGQTVTIIIGNAMIPDLITVLERHYTESSCARWQRLEKNILWIVPDLLYLFTNWNAVIIAMKAHLYSAESSGMKGILPVTIQTRLLHQQMQTAIEIREVLRIHQAIANHVIKLNLIGTADKDLDDRLELIKGQMDHNAATIDTVKEQLQNLIQLAFNLEAVSQGQSVARLSALAFIFIPLSYVASVFAIPGLAIDAFWYPASAVPLLVFTIFVAVIIGKFVNFWERWMGAIYELAPNEPITLGKMFSVFHRAVVNKDIEKGSSETTSLSSYVTYTSSSSGSSSSSPPAPSLSDRVSSPPLPYRVPSPASPPHRPVQMSYPPLPPALISAVPSPPRRSVRFEAEAYETASLVSAESHEGAEGRESDNASDDGRIWKQNAERKRERDEILETVEIVRAVLASRDTAYSGPKRKQPGPPRFTTGKVEEDEAIYSPGQVPGLLNEPLKDGEIFHSDEVPDVPLSSTKDDRRTIASALPFTVRSDAGVARASRTTVGRADGSSTSRTLQVRRDTKWRVERKTE
ncbi:hypothetical protein KXX44_008033 [Aspergillus fumigatus]|nr:hypothetical protein KXX44_008033 [Aspergillus fumigatus]KAH1839495.1 hypothetical protein KXX55_004995 [Aspergillus fumigatus]KAH3035778.1 hypothetical protein KXW01_005462 [Aspergillus fumigatus]KAH3313103.1 hypothetical protein KXW17_005863 [Aspergillus fumigatus]